METHERFTSVVIPEPVMVLVPRPSAGFASLVRLLMRYAKGDKTRNTIISDLSQVMLYYLLAQPPGLISLDDEDEDGDEAVIQEAVCRICEWGRASEWREGEEWIGDALVSIVRGIGGVECLPWRS